MKISTIIVFAIHLTLASSKVFTDDTKSNQITNNVNPDGTFQFGYQNNDRGGHYHQASGHPAIKVRGRYGSRNAGTGRVDDTVYTAGPRGFRARGTNIHRKQNLSQVPRSPIGSPTDPLADPYDDPSYAFGFKTKTHSRREESDSSGKVQGDFIYVDDVGEKHAVKYKAGANTGYEVENGVPDSPSSIRYNTPLYKSEPTARGRITFERGPDRQYKFLTSSPDQRRAESTGPDGITRGSYSYLDDKGVQRTVQYIAGAGIGYKVIQSTVGPGTHVSANADNPEYTVKAVSNEIAVSDGDGEDDSDYDTGPSAPTGPGYVSSTPSPFSPATPSSYPTPSPYPTPSSYPTTPSTFSSTTPYPPNSPFSTTSPYASTPRPFSRPNSDPVFVTTPSSIGGIDRNYPTPTVPTFSGGGPSPLSPSGPTGSGESDNIFGLLPPKEGSFFVPLASPSGPEIHITPAPPSASPTAFYNPTPTYLPSAQGHTFTASTHAGHFTPDHHQPQQIYHPLQHHPPLLPHHPPQLQHHPHPLQLQHQPPPHYQQPHPNNYPIDAVIKNTSTGWFYGVPPGAALRAHIQNIDLVPQHDRALSPSEALRLDEERERDAGQRYHRNSNSRV